MLSCSDRLGPHLGALTLVAILLTCGPTPIRALESPASVSDTGPTALAFHPAGLNALVRMAVIEAHRRLASAQCQELFVDFRDGSDRPLQERLDEIGQTAQSYLGWIWFVDGGSEGRCAQAEVSAFTSPGSQVVHFCGDRFTSAIARKGLGFLATVVIHEELRSLGLGENPPSTQQITRQVQSRCGS